MTRRSPFGAPPTVGAPPRSVQALRVAGGILLVMVGIWAGLRVYSSRAPGRMAERPERMAGIRVPAGEASPPTQSDRSDMREFEAGVQAAATIPERLPSFSLTDLRGKATPISQWEGKSLILNFWATWCAPCRREIPLLESLDGRWRDRDVQVVGIAVDYRDKVLAYAGELKIPYPLLLGEQDALDVAAKFGVDSPVFPFTVFTDRRGEVVALYVGELHEAQADLILSVVQDLNQGQVRIAEARRSIALGLRALASARPG